MELRRVIGIGIMPMLVSCAGARARDDSTTGSPSSSPTSTSVSVSDFVGATVQVPDDLTEIADAEGPIDDAVPMSAAMLSRGRNATVVFTQHVTSRPPGGPTQKVGPAGLVGCDLWSDGVSYRIVSRAVHAPDLCGNSPPDLSRAVVTIDHSPVPGTGAVPAPMSEHFFARSYSHRNETTGEQRSVVLGEFDGPSEVVALLEWWYGNGDTRNGLHHFEMDAYAEIAAGSDVSVAVPKAHMYLGANGGVIKFVRMAGLSANEQSVVIESLAGLF